MSARYVVADLWRNPRRTLSTMVGVVLGVGLFCGVLFFVDGLSASMTQRAVAPLPIDMQRIVTDRVGTGLDLTQTMNDRTATNGKQIAEVRVEMHNPSEVDANEVTLRSLPADGVEFVIGSARIDGEPVTRFDDNPFAHGPGRTGYNLGSIEPGASHTIEYELASDLTIGTDAVATSYSTRESVSPIAANQPASVSLAELAERMQLLDGVDRANQLSIADLGADTVRVGDGRVPGPAKIFGFDVAYADADPTIDIVSGALSTHGATISAEVATTAGAELGDTVSITLPDGSGLELPISGVADVSRSRSLFSSRRGGDLETFIYTPNSVIVSPGTFADVVFPAYERAAAGGDGRLKNPPIREVDVTLDREGLDADPATALGQTERIETEIAAVAAHQDYILDNISNTLAVAAADAAVAKRLFVFLGLPGGLLAAMLAAYAGNVLAEGQRREQAILRVRGASRRTLLRMLALRTALLVATGALLGLALGYATAATILGRDSLERASTSSLATSAAVGTAGGLLATGLALYITGRRSIDHEINQDRSRLDLRAPLWRRLRLDLVGAAVLVVGTTVAIRRNAFDGASGSVYFGRGVELRLTLLVLPIAVWVTGSLIAARLTGVTLATARPATSATIDRPAIGLYRRSVGRRPWAIANATIIAALIVALATSLTTFTASYDRAKADDARYANGADIRVTPAPTAERTYGPADTTLFEAEGVTATPVIYGLSNTIVRSTRTSDPANVAAIDLATFTRVAPVTTPSTDALATLSADPSAVLLSRDMADFLQAAPGDTVNLLLARATDQQTGVDAKVAGLFARMPGFPDGADVVMSIELHTDNVPDKAPDFFLLDVADDSAVALKAAAEAVRSGPVGTDQLQIDTRETTLDRDQTSLAALNIAGLVDLDTAFALGMSVAAMAIFVFGLLLQRRREYITLRAQGLEPRTIRLLITAEAATAAIAGTVTGLLVGAAMGYYFVNVLRPLFVLDPQFVIPIATVAPPVLLVAAAAVVTSLIGSRHVNRLQPTELLRDE